MSQEELTTLRGKRLHAALARRALPQYQAGFFDDAVLNAFKAVEERLRQATGLSDADAMELIKAALHPQTGTLSDANAWASEREGLYLFFRGAFLSFRNGPAHRFLNLHAEEAFDLIILVNRLYLILEEAGQRQAAASAEPNTLAHSQREIHAPWLLDVNSDGQSEVIIARYDAASPINVFMYTSSDVQAIPVEPIEVGGEGIADVVLADVDNDGMQELVVINGYATGVALIFYKYSNGQFIVLKGYVPDTEQVVSLFPDAQVVDVDGDGQREVVSTPYEEVLDHEAPPDEKGMRPSGRVRYVWRWNRAHQQFDLIMRKVESLGGR